MNYELAKKLNDAGFPFLPYPEYQAKLPLARYGTGIHFGDGLLFSEPTLSELIEACGERFALLGVQDGIWCAYDTWDLPNAISNTLTRGSTPEEAVANLWLSLNEKKL